MEAKYPYCGAGNKSGVYKIICIPTSKFYIGSTSCFYKRKYQHAKRLRIDAHYNKLLQNAWNKYGEASFEFHIVEETSNIKAKRLACEEKHLTKEHDNQNQCFNIYRKPTSCEGRPFSKTPEETRKKLSASIKALWSDPEYRKRMSKAHKGKTSHRRGKKLSKQHIEKLSKSHKGKTGINSSRYKIYNVDLVSPSGEMYKGPIVCVAEFARQHGLCSRHLRLLVVGKVKSCKGWKRYE